MTRREQQHAYESIVEKRKHHMEMARRWDDDLKTCTTSRASQLARQRIEFHILNARKANQEARRIWNER